MNVLEIAPSPRAPRFPELDRSKGFAILSVVFIHAKVLEGLPIHDYVVNRAVPIFLVLFGATSELWWRAHTAGDVVARFLLWCRKRFARLLPPVWAAACVWWLVSWLTATLPRGALASQHYVLLSLAGFCPSMGTSWFVFLILQLVVLFPLIHWAARLSLWFVLLEAAVVSAASEWHAFHTITLAMRFFGDRVPHGGFYYHWVFAPRVFWHVVAGIALASFLGRLGWRVVAACAALLALEPAVVALVHTLPGDAFVGPLRQEVAMAFFDVPLAVLVLGLFQLVRLPKALGRFLEWAGAASWGIYVGHALVYEIAQVLGHSPETGSRAGRALFAAALFVCGAALTLAARALLGLGRAEGDAAARAA